MKSIRFSLRAALAACSFTLLAAPAFAEDVWKLVTETSTPLAVDDVVIIAAQNQDFAMSTEQKTSNRGQAAITKDASAGTCTFGDDVQQFTIKTGNVAGTYSFYTGSGYIYAAGSAKNNYLKTQASNSNNSSWIISFANDVASIVAQGSNSNNVLQHNSGSKLFSCYASASQKPLVLYRKESDGGGGDMPPLELSVSPISSTIHLGETVTAQISANRGYIQSSLTASVGTLDLALYSWTPDAPGIYTVTFSAKDPLTLNFVSVDFEVTVIGAEITAPTLYNITDTFVNSTGFTATWEPVSDAASYQLQIATNALFDTVPVTLATEDFATLAATSYPAGWSGSNTSDLGYLISSTSAINFPSFKFKLAGQTLTSPTFAEGIRSVRFSAKPASNSDGESITLSGNGPNGPVSTTVTLLNGSHTYNVELEAPVSAVTFTYNKLSKNCALDDIVLSGTYNAIVETRSIEASPLTSIIIDTLEPNTQYFVRVRSVAQDGSTSDWSRTVSATTLTGSTPFPPELTVLSTTNAVVGAQAVGFYVTFSDANAEDTLTLTLAVNDGDPEVLDITSGTALTFIPEVVGLNTLVFSLTDGTFTTTVTKTVDVSLDDPYIYNSNLTLSPLGFTTQWYPVSLAETIELEVATDPAFDTAPGTILFSEDFSNLTKNTPPPAWSASSDGSGSSHGLQFTGSASCGTLAPAFRFANDGEFLTSPTFAPAQALSFFASATAAGSSLTVIALNNGEIVESTLVTIANGRDTYALSFNHTFTQLRFVLNKNGANVGLDDVVVYDVASRDTRIATRTVDATSSPLVFTDLAPATTWYVRARAHAGSVTSEWSYTTSVKMLPAPTQIRITNGKYVEDGVRVTWNPVDAADSYRVSVAQSRILPDTLIHAEDFTNGKQAPGWTFSSKGIGTYTTIPSSGESAGSLQFSEADSYAITPYLEYAPETVSFWTKCASNRGTCELTIRAQTNLSWVTLDTLHVTNDAENNNYTLDLPAGTTYVAFILAQKDGSASLALDDVVIRGRAPVYEAPTTYTTPEPAITLSGLRGNNHIRVIVSSLYQDLEVPSNPTLSKTSGYNPGTLIRLY